MRRADGVVIAPWLVVGAAELWFSQHGFIRPTGLQIAFELVSLAVIGGCLARFAPTGPARSPLIPAIAVWSVASFVVSPSLFAAVGLVGVSAAVVVGLERLRSWGVVAGCVLGLVGAGMARYTILARSTAEDVSSVSKSPAWQVISELAPPRWQAKSAGSGPPLVLITIDTLRADHAVEMASFKAVAAKGTLWRRAVSTSSWTVPALGSLLTGEIPAVHGAGLHEGGGFQALNPEVPTLSEVLAGQGYTSAAFTTNAWLAGGMGYDRGFDVYRHADADFQHRLMVAGFPRTPRADEAEVVVDEALAWLEGAPDQGWFLWVHLLDPHLPFFHADGDIEVLLTDEFLRSGMRHDAPLRDRVRAAYAVEVAYTDRHLLRLVEGLERHGIFERGIVALTADHGEEFWDHGATGHGHQHHTEVVDVALALGGVGVKHNPGVVSVADVPSTLAAVAGVSLGAGLDLRQPVPDGRIVVAQGNAYFEQQRSAVGHGMRVIFDRPEDEVGTCFTISSDPGELNGAPCDPGPVVQAARTSVPPAKHGQAADLSHSEKEALKALGYLVEDDP